MIRRRVALKSATMLPEGLTRIGEAAFSGSGVTKETILEVAEKFGLLIFGEG